MRNYKAWLSVLQKQWFIAEKNSWGLAGDLLETGGVTTREPQGRYYSEEKISGKKIGHLVLFERGLHRAGMLFFALAIMISMFLTVLLLSVSYFSHIFPIIIFAVSLMTGLIIEFMCRGDKYE